MLQKYLIYFVLSIIIFQSSKGNEYVNEVNNMLTHPYWKLGIDEIKELLGMYPQFTVSDIINNKIINMNCQTLFPPLANKYVTENNFQEKVIQYHFLLSCYYGIELMSYLYYAKELCQLCKLEDPEVCEIPLRNKLCFFKVELIKMKNSLFHFTRWLTNNNNTQLMNTVNAVINDVLIISENINAEILENIVQNLNSAYNKIKIFLDNHMIPNINENDIQAVKTIKVANELNNISLKTKVNYIFSFFDKNLGHIVNNNKQLGFIYDNDFNCLGVINYKDFPNTPSPQCDEDD